MPGIFGFTHPASSETTSLLLDQMTEALRDEKEYQSDQYAEQEISMGRVGLAIIQPFPLPAWNKKRSVAVVMEGEIFDYKAHRTKLEEKGYVFETDSHAELFAHLYQDKGEHFANILNGAFVAAIWDRENRRLVIINDHLGLQPLYYAESAQGIIFSSGMRGILVHPEIPRSFDRLAAAQFLTFDHVLFDRTLISGVRLLPGGTVLTYSGGTLRLNQYWRPQYPEFYPVRLEESYLEELWALLVQAAKRQMPGNHTAAILMSGGLDSRVIAGLLRDQSGSDNVQTFTMGQPGCDDERYASEVSKSLGFSHQFYHLRGDFLLKVADHGVRLTDGMGNVAHMHTLPNLNDQAHRAQVIYKGFLGDALIGYGISNRHFASYEKQDIFAAQLDIHREQGLLLFEPSALDKVMIAEDGVSFENQVLETYAQAILASQTSLPADQRNYFDLCQRVPRMTLNGVEWVRSQAHVRLPFADKDLVNFMLGVPPGLRYNRGIIKELFIKRYPELAKIPYTETSYPMVHCRREVQMRAMEQTRWWLRSIGIPVSMPQKRSYVKYNEWLRVELRQWAEDLLLSKRTKDRGIFNPVFVQDLYTRHLAGEKHYTRLGTLISIELWHRQFMDSLPR